MDSEKGSSFSSSFHALLWRLAFWLSCPLHSVQKHFCKLWWDRTSFSFTVASDRFATSSAKRLGELHVWVTWQRLYGIDKYEVLFKRWESLGFCSAGSCSRSLCRSVIARSVLVPSGSVPPNLQEKGTCGRVLHLLSKTFAITHH